MQQRDVADLSLAQLVDLLDDLEEKRTPVGWTPDDAVLTATVERRILEIIGAEVADGERRATIRIPCELAVVIQAKDRRVNGTVRNLGVGGALVEADTDLPVGTHVYLRVPDLVATHGLRARGRIAWRQRAPAGVGVSFAEQPSSAHERRLRRFVLAALEHREDV